MNWKIWTLGIVHALIAGAAQSLGALLAEPEHFNLSSMAGAKHLGVIALSGAIIGLVMYLKQSPLPAGWEGNERRKP